MYNNYTNPYYTGYNGANFNANPYGSPSVQFNPNYAQNGSQGFGQQQVQQQQQQQAIEYVNGLEGAKGYLMLANSTKLLMDSDGNYFYIKSANQNGQANIRIFKYQEVTQESQPKLEPKVEYATLKDLEELKKQIDDLKLNVGCYSYLLEEIFDFPVRYCDDGETVGDIIGMYPNNIMIIRTDGHLTCGFYGVLSDLWDCSDMLVDRYWIAY